MKHRIAIIGNRAYPHDFVGTSGIELYTEKILEHFSSKVLCTIYVKKQYQERVNKIKNKKSLTVVSVPTIRSKVFESVFYSFFASIRSVFDGSTVVWYHGVGQAIFSFIPKVLGKKTIITVHSEDWKRKKWSFLEGLLFTLLTYFVFSISKKNIFVVSRKLQKSLLDQFGVSAQITYPGFMENKTGKVRNSQKKNSILKNFNLEKNKFFLYLGRFVPEKKVELLIESFIKLNHRYPEYKLVLAGGANQSNEYVKKINSLCSQNQSCVLTDYVFGKDKEDLLSNMKALILPSELEGNSISVMEAISKNKPILIRESCLDSSSFRVNEGLYTFQSDLDFQPVLESLYKKKKVSVKVLKETAELYSWKRSAEKYLQEVLH